MALAEHLLAAALLPSLNWRSRPGLVRSCLEGLPYQPAAQAALPRARVAVVQFAINLAPSAQAFARHAYTVVRQAVAEGANLVLFPEYTSLPLLGLLPGAQYLSHTLKGRGAEDTKAHGAGGYGTMALAFRLMARAARRVYWTTFTTLAARFQVTTMAGSLIEMGRDGRLHNVGYLFGPDGTLLARQEKTHLVPGEVAMGYAVGAEINVVDTPAGRLAFPICMDHTYFETARIAALLGADLVIDPSANNEYYNPYAQARGVWNRVQEVQTYGILCSGVGEVAGTVFQGRSGVYAPLEMTPAGDGILATAKTYDQEEILIADLDYSALHDYRRRKPLEFNLELYRYYLPQAYSWEPASP